MAFECNLEDNIFRLQEGLSSQIYQHGGYSTFKIYDPKLRLINKASVCDRLVHQLVFKELCRIFESNFICHSYSSRLSKGSHLAIGNLAKTLRKASRNYSLSTFALKCDVKKFFASVPHQKLLEIIKRKVSDKKFLWLIEEIISSFAVPVDKFPQRERERERELKDNAIKHDLKRGLPIGNVTSQIFANIYLNELDQFIKHQLKIRHYFRYADDFIIVSDNHDYLRFVLEEIKDFLANKLLLELHPDKIEIRKFRQGVDFLGYVVLPHYIVLRTKTKRRMMKKLARKRKLLLTGELDAEKYRQSVQSYLGILKHCRGYKLEKLIKDRF